jgi:hypothetical protein
MKLSTPEQAEAAFYRASPLPAGARVPETPVGTIH